jgi:hypothetical protein
LASALFPYWFCPHLCPPQCPPRFLLPAVCVCVRERESACACVCEREKERMCVCVRACECLAHSLLLALLVGAERAGAVVLARQCFNMR